MTGSPDPGRPSRSFASGGASVRKKSGSSSRIGSRGAGIDLKSTPGGSTGKQSRTGAVSQGGKESRTTPVDRRLSLFSVASAVAVLLIILAVWRSCSQPSGVAPKSLPRGQEMQSTDTFQRAGADGRMKDKAETAPPAVQAPVASGAPGAPIVASVHLSPTRPLATDSVRAEARILGGENEGTTFLYQWKINGRFVPDAQGNTLEGVELKRRDRISVVVRAIRDGQEGPGTESQTVVVHSLPPSLEMRIITEQLHPGDVAEIQLIGAAPDGDKLIYSLVTPFADGMEIDSETGKILWKPRRFLQGKVPFGASVVDTDGNRTTRVFEIDLGAGYAR